MRTVRIISNFLFILTRILAFPYLATALYALVVFLLLNFKPSLGLPINIIDDGTRFEILFPFTNTPFLLGDNNFPFIVEMLLFIALYGIFFWLLSDVFNAFKQKKIFTKYGVVKLSRFYIANLAVPIVVFIVLSLLSQDERSYMGGVVALHFIIGVFAFFMAAIFKQGVSLQNEQDLII